MPSKLRPPLRFLRLRPPLHRRAFFSFPSSSSSSSSSTTTPSPLPHNLETQSILAYPPEQIFAIIADVNNYSSFLPYCLSSTVHEWAPRPPPDIVGLSTNATHITATTHAPSPPPPPPPCYPSLATLTIGFGPLTTSYTSRIYYIPYRIVEAVSGRAGTTIAAAELAQHGQSSARDATYRTQGAGCGGILESLSTRWTLEGFSEGGGGGGRGSRSEQGTVTTLRVSWQFSNAGMAYAAERFASQLSKTMTEAFVSRARELYGARELPWYVRQR